MGWSKTICVAILCCAERGGFWSFGWSGFGKIGSGEFFQKKSWELSCLKGFFKK